MADERPTDRNSEHQRTIARRVGGSGKPADARRVQEQWAARFGEQRCDMSAWA